MIYTEQTKRALSLMFSVHKDMVDKSGMPYVFHPYHLAEDLYDENEIIVALLHDVVEDSELTLDDLIGYGFPSDAIEAIALMTHDKDMPYFDYVIRLSKNRIARRVKMLDLLHNMDTTRLGEELDEKGKLRVEKYKRAYRLLTEISLIGTKVNVKIDRPLGSIHPTHKNIIYTLNYGYIPDTIGGDGEELDAYVLGVSEAVNEFEGVVIGVIMRENDNEEKLIVSDGKREYTDEEIEKLTGFQEKYFKSTLIR